MLIKTRSQRLVKRGLYTSYTDEHCLYTWGAELEEFQLEHIL